MQAAAAKTPIIVTILWERRSGIVKTIPRGIGPLYRAQ